MMRAALLVLALAGTAHATPCKPYAGAHAITFAAEQSLDSFAQWLVEKTCTRVEFARDVAAEDTRVTILAPNPMTAKQAIAFFVASVEATGHVVTTKAGVLHVARGKGVPLCIATPPSSTGIAVKDPWTFELDGALLDERLADLDAVLAGLRVVPFVSDGKPAGFKLYAIRPSSLAAQLGFSNGDTVVKIGGVLVDSAESARAAYVKARKSKKIVVDIVRRGRPVSLVYAIN